MPTNCTSRKAAAFCVVLLALLTSGCGERIEGQWSRDEITLCSIAYPGEIEFLEDGTYLVRGPAAFWKGGTYAHTEDGRLRLDTISGPAMYDIRLTAENLEITNSQGCRITYSRADSAE